MMKLEPTGSVATLVDLTLEVAVDVRAARQLVQCIKGRTLGRVCRVKGDALQDGKIIPKQL
jgi:hypothetical protein